jgi:hypothetical protein
MPLYRYLRTKVGQPWDAVYSDICRNLPKGVHRFHIDSHLKRAVHLDCHYAPDGGIYPNGRVYKWSRLDQSSRPYPQVYVHPDTGILTATRYVPKPADTTPPTYITETVSTHYELIDGIWYYLWNTREEVRYIWSFDDGIPVWKTHMEVVTHKRQLSRKELYILGVKNAA